MMIRRIAALALCTCLAGCLEMPPPQDPSLILPVVQSVQTDLATGSPPQWSGWRGGELHGVADENRLPSRWGKDDGVKWTATVPGQGNSSPVVHGERIFLTSVIATDRGQGLALICFQRQSGQLLWQSEVGSPVGPTHHKNGFASATAATDRRHVYACFGAAGLCCYDFNGNLRWRVALENVEHQWGTASSPVLFDSLVIQLCDNQQSCYLAAFHKLTGQQVWRTPREGHGSWTTPVVITAEYQGGQRRELIVNGTGNSGGVSGLVTAYDPYTGQPLWEVQGTTDIPCPTAIVGSGLVISTSGGNGPVFAVRPGGEGDVTRSHIAWHRPSGGPYVPTGVIYKDRLYLVTDGGVAACYDAQDGRQIWKQRLKGSFSASLVAGDGRIYAVSEQSTIYEVAAADQFQLLASIQLNERCLATPAIVDGQFILRTSQHLYCITGQRTDGAAAQAVQIEDPVTHNSDTSRDRVHHRSTVAGATSVSAISNSPR